MTVMREGPSMAMNICLDGRFVLLALRAGH